MRLLRIFCQQQHFRALILFRKKCPVVKHFPKRFCRIMVDKTSSYLGTHDYHHLSGLFQEVGETANENSGYFFQRQRPNDPSNYVKSFQTILHILDPLQISLEVVTNCCSKFDASPNCKGNGYRSVINIVESCLTKILELSKQIQKSREKLFFRSYHLYMELESYAQVLSRLLTVVHLTIVLLDHSDIGELFPHERIVAEVMVDFEKISRECFYGRSFGFQYAESIRQSMQVVAVAMAAYGDGYMRHNHSFARALSSMLHSGKYVVDPELRAKRITELTQNADIDFCKAFWSLTEEHGVQHAPLLMCPAMAVNLEFTIPTTPQCIATTDGKSFTLDFPYLNSEQNGIKARLLSYVWREGQMHDSSLDSNSITPLGPRPSPKSKYLMFHCHGGGFVAQSSKSHEMYLRYWAKELKIPILSIDYSLAPDAPYPQALNEIYFAYVWALNNLHKLGTTGEKIVLSGDSAGANLVTCLSLKSIKSNIRLADSIVVAYPPYRIQFLPSPSRILCLMDPLLPLGVLKSCIEAYCGSMKKPDKRKQLNSLSHGSTYNPYDVDIGHDQWDTFNRFKLDHSHSFSETNLNLIKSRLFLKHRIQEDDQESFYSEFPCSDTDDSFLMESDVLCDKTKHEPEENDYINFSVKEKDEGDEVESTNTDSVSTSLFSSLTTQVSSKVHDLSAGVTNLLYGRETQTSDKKTTSETNLELAVNDVTRALEEDILKNWTFCENQSNKSFSRKRSLDSTPSDVQSKQLFRICKECLHRSELCSCNQSNVQKRLDSNRVKWHHYQHQSRHHISDKLYTPKTRSKSFSKNDDLFDDLLDAKTNLRRCISTCDRQLDKSHSSEEKEDVKPKDICKQVSLNLNSNSDNGDTAKSPVHSSDSSVGSPKLSGRVIYDKDTDCCLILTADDESVDVDYKTPENEAYHMFMTSYHNGKDPYMSPYLADDTLLKKLPPITIVACSLDPLFDDSVAFVKKLKKLDKDAELYVLDRLPHGFLNFQVFSNEAREGCDLLIACIKKSLGMGMRRQDSSMLVRPTPKTSSSPFLLAKQSPQDKS